MRIHREGFGNYSNCSLKYFNMLLNIQVLKGEILQNKNQGFSDKISRFSRPHYYIRYHSFHKKNIIVRLIRHHK